MRYIIAIIINNLIYGKELLITCNHLYLDDFDDDDEDMVKHRLSMDDPTDNPEKEMTDSRRATLRSPAKFGSLFRNGGKQR